MSAAEYKDPTDIADLTDITFSHGSVDDALRMIDQFGVKFV